MIEVCLCADARFVVPLAVTLRSIADSQPSPETVHVVVGSFGIDRDDQEALRTTVGPLTVDFVDLDRAIGHDVPTSAHLSRAMYGRCTIFEHLGTDATRAVYLDCDLIVLDDLGYLASFDLGTSPVAAVQTAVVSQSLVEWKELGLPPRTPYLNSGVLVADLAAWRARDLGNAVIDFVYAHRETLRWGDQDGFNGVLAGDFARLPMRWNQESALRRPTTSAYLLAADAEVDEAITDPAIIHFTGQHKPWHAGSTDPAAAMWHEIRARTAFADRAPISADTARPRPPMLAMRRRVHSALRRVGRR